MAAKLRINDRRVYTLAVIVVLILSSPLTTFACACCAETAHYYSGVRDFDEHPLSQLKRMRFARSASLYITDAGLEEHSVGIDRPRENYSVMGSLVANTLKLTFRSGSQSGVLDLPLPKEMWSHSADIHDKKPSPGGGPLLYKEWRFEGDVTGAGIFKSGTPAKYTLLLQGRGNGCDNAEDFSNWRLEVRGEKARYAFYGKFMRPVRER